MENFETDTLDVRPALPLPHERLMAALAHLSAFVPWFGWLIAFTFWFANRGEARYAAYQAKQACVFQLFMAFISVVSWLSSFVLFRLDRFTPFQATAMLTTALQNPVYFFPVMMIVTFTLSYSVVGAVYCAWGLPFRYRFITLWLRPE